MSEGSTSGGRTRITARALDRVVTATTREAFGGTKETVKVDLTDNGGTLDLAVRTAIRVVSIARAQGDSRAIGRSGGSILDRCTAAEEAIRSQVARITGYDVGRVTVQLTGVHTEHEQRVR